MLNQVALKHRLVGSCGSLLPKHFQSLRLILKASFKVLYFFDQTLQLLFFSLLVFV